MYLVQLNSGFVTLSKEKLDENLCAEVSDSFLMAPEYRYVVHEDGTYNIIEYAVSMMDAHSFKDDLIEEVNKT